MKRMVRIAVIAVLVLPALVGIASAGIDIEGDPYVRPLTGISNTEFYYYANISGYEGWSGIHCKVTIHNTSTNIPNQEGNCYEDNGTCRIGPVVFSKYNVEEAENASFIFGVYLGNASFPVDSKPGEGPIVYFDPQLHSQIPAKIPTLYYLEDISFTIAIKDKRNSTAAEIGIFYPDGTLKGGYLTEDCVYTYREVAPYKSHEYKCCIRNPFNKNDSNITGPFMVNLSYPNPSIPSPKDWNLYNIRILSPPQPNIDLSCPKAVAFDEDFNIIARITDVVGSCGITPVLKFINCSNNSDIRDSPSPPPGCEFVRRKYEYNWSISGIFGEEDVRHNFDVNLTYDNDYYMKNKTCLLRIVKSPPPKIINVNLNAKSLDSSAELNIIDNVEWKDLDGTLPFEVTIEDKKGVGNATLKKCEINDSTPINCSNNFTLKCTGSDGLRHHYRCNVPFNESDAKKKRNFSLLLYYDRPKLPSPWPSPWEDYNITLIPFEINFENATVSPPSGPWNDTFNYSVNVSASRDLYITLKVFDPCTEEWPWKPVSINATRKYSKDGGKTLYWNTEPNNPPFSENCKGQSKFYFEYLERRMSPVYPGPELFKPPEFDNRSVDPNVTIYCNWSNSSTLCNYSVNVTTEDEYKVGLLVKDPVSNDWIPKGDVKAVSRETKNITWTDITPFESLNMDNITQYIGNETRADFTFEYDEHKANKNFSGSLLVGAFRDPKIDREEISYNDTFNYSIDVIGSRNLNVTLKYYNGRGWVNASKTEPTKYYTPNGWETLPWQCIANETWEKVMMEVKVEGEKKPIKVY